jgi:hypothetical protein
VRTDRTQAKEAPSLGHNEALNSLLEEPSKAAPPEATVVRRAKSYTDFYHVVRAQMTKELKKQREKERKAIKIPGHHENIVGFEIEYETYEDELLDASQEEFQYAITAELQWLAMLTTHIGYIEIN